MKRTIARLFGITLTILLAFFWASLIWPADAAPEPATALATAPAATKAAGAVSIPLDRVTYYHATPEQTDADPETSACGPNRARQIAVSRDLFRRVLPCGSIVHLHLDGVGDVGEFIVWDTMHTRWTATADILVPEGHHPTWGRTTGTLTILEVNP